MHQQPSRSQEAAWRDSLLALKITFEELGSTKSESAAWGVILEYELPRERGRRPDVLIFAPGRLVVLEFKAALTADPEALDQVEAYARDLREYQEATRDLTVIPVLVTGAEVAPDKPQKVHVAGLGDLSTLLADVLELAAGPPTDLHAWAAADYAPLPALVTAARRIFNHEPLPAIKRAQSAGIPEAMEVLTAAAKRAKEASERHLAVVTGVPGAGKTLVGFQFVHSTRSVDEDSKDAVFLSGNGPLVKVLQHALGETKVFVQDVHGFLVRYGGNSTRIPKERIWVYDEAQRAWDSAQVRAKRNHDLSEPEDFLRIGARFPDWAMMIGLIGEGQEIYVGEESGIGQWNDAIGRNPAKWHVHCPPKLRHVFSAAHAISETNALDLTTSLRSHVAVEVQDWVRDLLLGKLDQAATAATRAQAAGYVMYLCDDLSRAKDYVQTRYQDAPDARFGLIASSKGHNLQAHGFRNGFADTRMIKEGPWFNDEPSSAASCCQLQVTVTEFQCQGLELEFPIVGWGHDLFWDGTQWKSRPEKKPKTRDPHNLRLNSYRVLLSRGRDGLIVFCPPDTQAPTREALIYSGLTLLK
jgi:hypothetical protein